MDTKIDHIGIAVCNIEERLQFYTNILGLNVEHTETVVQDKVKTAFLKVGSSNLELL